MIRKLLLLPWVCVFAWACQTSAPLETLPVTDRRRDGFTAEVKAVLTDDVTFVERDGQLFESQQASSVSLYDEAGKKTLETPFRVALPGGYVLLPHDAGFNPQAGSNKIEEPIVIAGVGSGKLVKSFDAHGLLVERVRYEAGGALAVTQRISYEFDQAGNWVKRITKQLNDKNGRQSWQPVEASYRLILYRNAVAAASPQPAEPIPASARALQNPLAATESHLSAGATLFNQRCATCHGENGKAQTEIATLLLRKPADLTVARNLSDGEIFEAIRSGLTTSRMPALKNRINESATWQIVLYVRRLQSGQGDEHRLAAATATPAPERTAPVAETRRYKLRGKIVSLSRERQEVTVEHEAIEGYMGAMTMPFPLKDARLLEKLKAGDSIQATLVIDGKGWRLEQVTVRQ
ncbi:MAG: copper-binding protein [Candidatus Binatia bacterium]